jgi:hypothetical protein
MLREKLVKGPNKRKSVEFGYFLHTPFPSSKIYRILPVRNAILESVLHCDLIGFHTYDYARHFLRTHSSTSTSSSLTTGGRMPRHNARGSDTPRKQKCREFDERLPPTRCDHHRRPPKCSPTSTFSNSSSSFSPSTSFMNSFNTDKDTVNIIKKYEGHNIDYKTGVTHRQRIDSAWR